VERTPLEGDGDAPNVADGPGGESGSGTESGSGIDAGVVDSGVRSD
jgi:hypothetical protein